MPFTFAGLKLSSPAAPSLYADAKHCNTCPSCHETLNAAKMLMLLSLMLLLTTLVVTLQSRRSTTVPANFTTPQRTKVVASPSTLPPSAAVAATEDYSPCIFEKPSNVLPKLPSPPRELLEFEKRKSATTPPSTSTTTDCNVPSRGSPRRAKEPRNLLSQFDRAARSPRFWQPVPTESTPQRHVERRRSSLGRDDWLKDMAPRKLDSSQILLDMYARE